MLVFVYGNKIDYFESNLLVYFEESINNLNTKYISNKNNYIFGFKLYDKSKEKIVFVNDYIPVINSNVNIYNKIISKVEYTNNIINNNNRSDFDVNNKSLYNIVKSKKTSNESPIKLNDDMQFSDIVIEDSKYVPAFVKPSESFAWILLLEKALSSILGSYELYLISKASCLVDLIAPFDKKVFTHSNNIKYNKTSNYNRNNKSSICNEFFEQLLIIKETSKNPIIIAEKNNHITDEKCVNICLIKDESIIHDNNKFSNYKELNNNSLISSIISNTSFFLNSFFIYESIKYVELVLPEIIDEETFLKIKHTLQDEYFSNLLNNYISELSINKIKISILDDLISKLQRSIVVTTDFYYMFFDKTFVFKYVQNEYYKDTSIIINLDYIIFQNINILINNESNIDIHNNNKFVKDIYLNKLISIINNITEYKYDKDIKNMLFKSLDNICKYDNLMLFNTIIVTLNNVNNKNNSNYLYFNINYDIIKNTNTAFSNKLNHLIEESIIRAYLIKQTNDNKNKNNNYNICSSFYGKISDFEIKINNKQLSSTYYLCFYIAFNDNLTLDMINFIFKNNDNKNNNIYEKLFKIIVVAKSNTDLNLINVDENKINYNKYNFNTLFNNKVFDSLIKNSIYNYINKKFMFSVCDDVEYLLSLNENELGISAFIINNKSDTNSVVLSIDCKMINANISDLSNTFTLLENYNSYVKEDLLNNSIYNNNINNIINYVKLTTNNTSINNHSNSKNSNISYSNNFNDIDSCQSKKTYEILPLENEIIILNWISLKENVFVKLYPKWIMYNKYSLVNSIKNNNYNTCNSNDLSLLSNINNNIENISLNNVKKNYIDIRYKSVYYYEFVFQNGLIICFVNNNDLKEFLIEIEIVELNNLAYSQTFSNIIYNNDIISNDNKVNYNKSLENFDKYNSKFKENKHNYYDHKSLEDSEAHNMSFINFIVKPIDTKHIYFRKLIFGNISYKAKFKIKESNKV